MARLIKLGLIVLISFSILYAIYFAFFEGPFGHSLKNNIRTFEFKEQNKPHTRNVSTKRDFVASNGSAIFIFGAAGINSTSERVWDKFNVYGQRHRLGKEKALVCCLIYNDGQVSQTKIAENRHFYLTGSVPLPLFNVVCNNIRQAHTDTQKTPEVPRGISVVYEGDSCKHRWPNRMANVFFTYSY